MRANPPNQVTKWTFPGLFKEAWESALNKNNIVSGFRSCGIYPYNASAVSVELTATSIPTHVPTISLEMPQAIAVPTGVTPTALLPQATATATSPPVINTALLPQVAPSHQSTTDSQPINLNNIQLIPLETDISA